ncbi:hypothetical protein ACF0H5_021156 [Mactra antiquata]
MEVDEAVNYFCSAKSRQKFRGNTELISALECIEHTALNKGLSPEHISSLVDVAAAGIQVETVCKRIIKSLIPQTYVKEEAALKCISWICTRNPSINIQCLLLRWIIVIYDYIDTRTNLHGMYGVLFHFLHYRVMMPYICHLLYLFTRKEDVRLFRVRFLLQYQKDMGPQPFLTGLLSIYRYYYPSLVHVVNTRSYKSFFPTYDKKWSSVIQQVREKIGVSPTIDVTFEKALLERLGTSSNYVDLMPSKKRRKLDPIPVLHSLTTKSSYKRDTMAHTLGLQTIPFVLIQSFKGLLDHLDNVEYPSQIGAVLRSDPLKHFMSFTKDQIACARFQFWISKTLQEALVNSLKPNHKQRVTSLLKSTKLFSDFLQEGIPAVDIEIFDYLHTWNGIQYSPLILQLISRSRIYPFPVLYDRVLEPLRKLFFSSSVYGKCKIIMCFTDLLRNYAANEWPRNQEKQDEDTSLCLFKQDKEDFDGSDVIKNIVKFVCKICLTGLVIEKHNGNALFEMCVLDFLDLVSNMHKEYNIPFVVMADSRLMETLLISCNILTVNRVCTVLCRYKENFDLLRAAERNGQLKNSGIQRETSRLIKLCNSLVVDFCNSLWRLRAFTSTDKHSLFYQDISDLDKENMNARRKDNESLSLFCHPAFLPFTLKYIEKNDFDPRINIEELRPLKRDFLHVLERHHFTGLSQFVSTFVRRESESSTSKSQMFGFSPTSTHVSSMSTSRMT